MIRPGDSVALKVVSVYYATPISNHPDDAAVVIVMTMIAMTLGNYDDVDDKNDGDEDIDDDDD